MCQHRLYESHNMNEDEDGFCSVDILCLECGTWLGSWHDLDDYAINVYNVDNRDNWLKEYEEWKRWAWKHGLPKTNGNDSHE